MVARPVDPDETHLDSDLISNRIRVSLSRIGSNLITQHRSVFIKKYFVQYCIRALLLHGFSFVYWGKEFRKQNLLLRNYQYLAEP